jgi:flap endonuclease-1
MGVNLGNIIVKKEIDFSYLKNKKVAVDAFNCLYQFLASIRGADGTPLKDSNGNITSHLQGLFSRSLNLMSKGIKLVYVFDGEPPELKYSEIKSRVERKEEAVKKYKEAIDSEDIENMYKYSKQSLRLTKEMVEESKKLIEALGLPFIQAPSEADYQMTYMCQNGDVDFIASTDYDGLLLGAPKLVRNLTLSQKRKVPGGKYVTTFLELITLNDVLKELNINQDQLIALGILIGTDYDPSGVKGIGPKKALALVKKHRGVEEIFNEVECDFDWKEIYKLFKDPIVSKKYKLEWDSLDIKKIKDILVDRHEFNEERIMGLIEKYKEENKDLDQKGLCEFI